MERSYISQNPDPIPGPGWHILGGFGEGISIIGGQ